MHKSEAIITSPDVLNNEKENKMEGKVNEVEKEATKLINKLDEKKSVEKKHHKEACKGCDGICCTKKIEKENSVISTQDKVQ